MKMLQLLYFQSVAETGKMIDAAKEMHVTPAAISIAISNLEKELGVPLFDRTHNSVALNAAGQAYLLAVRKFLHDLHTAEEAIFAGGGSKSCQLPYCRWRPCPDLSGQLAG